MNVKRLFSLLLILIAAFVFSVGQVSAQVKRIEIGAGTTAITEAGTTSTHSVVLSSAPSATVTVTLSYNTDLQINPNGTGFATGSVSFVFTTVNWSTPQSYVVSAFNDSLVEGSQTAAVSYSATSADSGYNNGNFRYGGTGGSVTSTTYTITDNDTATVAYSGSTGTAPESVSPYATTVALAITSNPVGGTLESQATVAIAATAGTAATPADYTLATTLVTFIAGSPAGAQPVNVTIVNDTTPESDETFTLSFGTITGTVTTTAPTTQVVTITDPEDSFTVTNTNDSGAGSLRQAISDANSAAGADTITFNIGTGVQTINLSSALPSITGPVTIDGSTQPGSSCDVSARVLNIVVKGTGAFDGITLASGSDGSIIRGLVLQSFVDAVEIASDGNRIDCNYIGIDQTGELGGTTYRNSTGVNILSGAESNTIGTNNDSANDANERNVISNNSNIGVIVDGNSNTIAGNYIGTDKDGEADLGNGLHGIYVTANNATIGGTASAQRNVIGGNGTAGMGAGIRFEDAYTGTVYNSYVGVGADGTTSLGNEGNGILAFNNIIGTETNHIFGGTAAGQPNIIANNGGRGVDITDIYDNTVRGNSIYNNGSIGIDLNSNSVTANDLNDTDGGSNNQQNFPVITAANAGDTTIAGTLNSNVSTLNYTIDVYASAACDGTGYGEGQTWLGSAGGVNTDGSGNASFTVDISPATVPSGQFITATATDANGNTSEFSACFETTPPAVVITNTDGTGNIDENGTSDYDYSIALTTTPSSNVAVELTFGDDLRVNGQESPVTFNFNSTAAQPFTVTAFNDALVEGEHTDEITVAISSGDGSYNGITPEIDTVSTDTIPFTIDDNDSATIAFSGTSSTVAEETTPHAVGVVLTVNSDPAGGTLESAITVNITTGAGTATLTDDYTLPANIIFGAGSGSGSINLDLAIVNDAIAENDETIILDLGAVTGDASDAITTDSPSQHTVTITDTDVIIITSADENELVTAINNANTFPGADVIEFDIPGDGPHPFVLTGSLPSITEALTIDASTEPSADCTAWTPTLSVVIDGGGHTAFTVDAADVTIRGFAIHSTFGSFVVNNSRFVATCNLIGTDVTGTTVIGGARAFLINGGNDIRIGGPLDTDRNVIAGQGDFSLRFDPGAPMYNTVFQNNYVGTDVTGTVAMPNFGDVLQIRSMINDTLILDNLISGNGGTPLLFVDFDHINTTLSGNTIGLSSTGDPLPNAGGIYVTNTNGHTFEDNIIAHNNGAGILFANASSHVVGINTIYNNVGGGVVVTSGTNNTISSNSIYDNAGSGIDLASGANNDQQAPVITSAVPGTTSVNGTLTSTPDTTFVVEIFTNDSCDLSGFGEGQTLVGSSNAVTTNAGGSANFTISVPELQIGEVITATATNTTTGDTSAFSACLEVVPPAVIITKLGGDGNLDEDGAVEYEYSVALSAPPSATVAVELSFGADLRVNGQTSPVTLNFNDTTPETFTVKAFNDAVVEGEHTDEITVAVSSPDGNYDGITPEIDTASTDTIPFTIDDNDTVTVAFETTPDTVNEGDDFITNAVLTIVPDGGAIGAESLDTTITIDVGGISMSTDTSDFMVTTNTLTFNPGDLSEEVTVATTDDQLVEGDEQFELRFFWVTLPSTISNADDTQIVTIIEDDSVAVVLEADPAAVDEGASFNADVVMTVVPDGTVGEPELVTGISVDVSALQGTALAGDDYTYAGENLIFGWGNPLTQTITVMTTDDMLVEGDETFDLTLASSDPSVSSLGADLTVTITEDDSVTVALSADPTTVDEGSDFSADVTLTIVPDGTVGSAALATSIDVDASALDGTAFEGTDYIYAGETLTFSDVTPLTQSVTVPTTDDMLVEGDETFDLTLVSSNALVTATGADLTVTILEDDSVTVAFETTPDSVGEGNTFTTNAVLTFVPDGTVGSPALETTVTVDVVASPDTAEAEDFTLTTTSLTFVAGDLSEAVNVDTTADAFVEGDEDFILSFDNASDLISESSDTQTVTINDNDYITVAFDITETSVAEGDTLTGSVVASFNTSGTAPEGIQNPVTVDVEIGNISTEDADYTFTPQTLTFTDGDLTETINVPTTNDAFVEGDEIFQLHFANPSGQILDASDTHNVTIVDDDFITVAFVDTTPEVAEGGTFSVDVVANFDTNGDAPEAIENAVMVDVQLTDVTTEAADYTFATTLLTFDDLSPMTQTVDVPTTDDSFVEGDEDFALSFANASSMISDAADTHSATILDDDFITVTFEDTPLDVIEGDLFTVNAVVGFDTNGDAPQAIENDVTVDVAAGNISTENDDYTLNTTTLTFTAVDLSLPVDVQTTHDAFVEGDEDFQLSFTNPSSLITDSSDTHVATITDNDFVTVAFNLAETVIAEGSTQTGTVVASFDTDGDGSPTIENPVTVDVEIVDLTTETADYTFAPLTYSFNDDDLSEPLAIPTTHDALVEGDEDFELVFTNASSLISDASDTFVTTIDDDDFAVITFEDTPTEVNEGDTFTVNAVVSFDTNGDAPQAIENDVTVDVEISDVTTEPTDYTFTTQPLTFTTVDLSLPVDVVTNNDVAIEGDEDFELSFTNASVLVSDASDTHTATILDDDFLTVTFEDTPVDVIEGDTFTVNAVVNTNDIEEDVTVDVIIANLSTENDDYTFTTQTLTFSAVDQSVAVNVPTTHDAFVEGNEQFQLSFANASGLITNSSDTHTATIWDNDFVSISFDFAETTVAEGDTQSGSAIASFDTFGAGADMIENPVTVDLEINNLTTEDGDTTFTTQTLTFTDGDMTETINVPTTNDALVEGDEDFELVFANLSDLISEADEYFVTTIVDDDFVTVTFEDTPTEVNEGNTFTVNAVVSFDTNGDAPQAIENDVTVDVEISDVTTEPADYTFTTQTLTFTAVDLSLPVDVLTANDALVEGGEDFQLNLTNASVLVSDASDTHTATITDDDFITVTFEDTPTAVNEGDLFTVNAVVGFNANGDGTAAIENDVTVDVVAGHITTENADYTLNTTSLTFTAVDLSLPVDVQTTHDAFVEGDEQFELSFTNPSSLITDSSDTSAATIVDDDFITVTFDFAESVVIEGDTLSGSAIAGFDTNGDAPQAIENEVAVDVQIADVTTEPADYTFTTQTLTFTAVDLTLAVNVPTTPDTFVEGDEDFELSFTNASALVSDASDTHTATIEDNDFALVAFASDVDTTPESVGTYQAPVELTFISDPDDANASLEDDVTVTISDSPIPALNPDDYSLPTATLTLSAGSMSGVYDFGVTIENDDIDEGDESFSLTIDAVGGNASLNIDGFASLETTIEDDDTAAFIIAPTTLDVDETQTLTGSYTVRLNSQPTGDVIVQLNFDGQVELSLDSAFSSLLISPETLTFTDSNWFEDQTVYVRAVDDSDVELAIHQSTIEQSIDFITADQQYFLLDPEDITVNITDNDTPGVTVTTGNTALDENNTAVLADYTVQLDSRPAQPVTFTIGFDPAQVIVNGDSSGVYQFGVQPNDWNVAQPISVQVINDDIDENDPTYTVDLTNSVSSADANYNFNADTVTLTITDNDTAGVTLTTFNTLLDESIPATIASYTVQLASRPTADVTITATFDPAQVSINGDSDGSVDVSFTPAEWAAPKAFDITVIDDPIDEGVTYTIDISNSAFSTDLKYTGAPFTPSHIVTLTITDNDAPSLVIVETSGTAVSEGLTTDTYTVALTSAPLADVTVSLTFNNTNTAPVTAGIPAGIVVTPTTLTFTSGDWNQPQLVTVSAPEDFVSDAGTENIDHLSASTDPEFNGLTGLVVVTVSDVPVDDPSNLIKNGSFEIAGKTELRAQNWKLTELQGTLSRAFAPTTYTRRICRASGSISTDGFCAFRMGQPGAYNWSRILMQKIANPGVVQNLDTLTLSANVRGARLAKYALMQLRVFYPDGTRQRLNVRIAAGTYAYTLRQGSLPITGQPSKIVVRFMTRANIGMFWVDSVRLTLTTPAARGAESLNIPDTGMTGDGWMPLPDSDTSN